MEAVRSVGSIFFPLDNELALLPGQLAPRQQNHLVHLSSHMPFATATKMIEALLDVHISKESARRIAERMGHALEQAQTEAADAPVAEERDPVGNGSHLAMSADGAMIGLQTGEWVEVRTLVIGEIAPEKVKKKACPTCREPLVVLSACGCRRLFTFGRSGATQAEGACRRAGLCRDGWGTVASRVYGSASSRCGAGSRFCSCR